MIKVKDGRCDDSKCENDTTIYFILKFIFGSKCKYMSQLKLSEQDCESSLFLFVLKVLVDKKKHSIPN